MKRRNTEMVRKDTQHFNDANFKADVLDAEVPVLVDLYATWCGPCRALAPTVERIATEWRGRIKGGKLDVDENQAIAERYGGTSLPAPLLFKGGAVGGGVRRAVPQ